MAVVNSIKRDRSSQTLTFTITNFVGYSNSENLTLNENQNATRNINIFKTAVFTGAYLNLSGLSNYTGLCYMESANVSTSCRGLNNGVYSISN